MPFLEEIGAVQMDEFDKEWAEGGYTIEEVRSHLHNKIQEHFACKKK